MEFKEFKNETGKILKEYWITPAEWDALDKATVQEGDIYHIVGTISEEDLSASLMSKVENNAKVNSSNTFTESQIFNKDITINGNIIQKGDTYKTHAEELYTKKDIIFTREGAISTLGDNEYTGIQAVKYDGINDGQLVFDKDGTARVGDVGDTQPLATRSEKEELVGGNLLQWDAVNNKIIDAGKTTADFVPRKLYLHNVSIRLKYDPNVDLYVSWKVLNNSSTPFHQSTEASLDMAPSGKWFDFHAHGKFTLGANTIDSPYILKFYLTVAYRYYSSERVVYEWQFDEPTYVNTEGIVVTVTSAEPSYNYYSMLTPTYFIDNVVEL